MTYAHDRRLQRSLSLEQSLVDPDDEDVLEAIEQLIWKRVRN